MSEPVAPEEIRVPVEGGELAALYWAADAPSAPLVVLVHGITANAAAWTAVGAALAGEHEVVAVDLRGRGGSAEVPGVYGLQAHADDVTAVLEAYGADREGGANAAVLVGHSMGGFVAALAAAGPARDLVHGLVLVDGGLQLAVPPAGDVDAMLAAVLGPSLERLDLRFADLDDARAWWAQHPAVGPWLEDPAVDAYVQRDLVPSGDGLRSAVVDRAVRVDGGEVLLDEMVREASASLPVPATLLWATRGLLGESPGLYDEVRLAGLGLEPAGITAVEVPDTDHFSVLWSPQGVTAITDTVRAAVTR